MRRGVTLIEMVIVMTVGAVLTGIAIALLAVLLQAERGGREHVENNAVIRGLADQFRRDIHAATKLPELKGHRIVRLAAGGLTVQYTIDGPEVLRELITDGRSISQREAYRLPKDWTATVETDTTKKPPLVRLTVAPQDAALRSAHEIRVEAVSGRDLRFATLTKEAE